MRGIKTLHVDVYFDFKVLTHNVPINHFAHESYGNVTTYRLTSIIQSLLLSDLTRGPGPAYTHQQMQNNYICIKVYFCYIHVTWYNHYLVCFCWHISHVTLHSYLSYTSFLLCCISHLSCAGWQSELYWLHNGPISWRSQTKHMSACIEVKLPACM